VSSIRIFIIKGKCKMKKEKLREENLERRAKAEERRQMKKRSIKHSA